MSKATDGEERRGEERTVGASVAFSLPEMWTPAAQGGMETVNAQCVGHIGLRVVN